MGQHKGKKNRNLKGPKMGGGGVNWTSRGKGVANKNGNGGQKLGVMGGNARGAKSANRKNMKNKRKKSETELEKKRLTTPH